MDHRKQPQNTVELLTSTIKMDEELREAGMRFCFRVVSPEKEYVLQAENELEQKEWMEAIQVGRENVFRDRWNAKCVAYPHKCAGGVHQGL